MIKKCEICGEEHIHLTKIEVIMDEQAIIISGKNDVAITSLHDNSTRGVILKTTYGCENESHGFEVTERFHKGCTYADVNPIPTLCKGVLWRD